MRRSMILGACALVLAGAATSALWAKSKEKPADQPDPMQTQIDALKKGQDDMQKTLNEIKQMLQARPAAPAAQAAAQGTNVKDVVFNLGDNWIRGTNSAKVTLIEFTDYQCPYCGRYVHDTYPQIAKEYVDTGKVRYVMLDLPLESMHRNAFKAAEAAHCAGDQGKYWEMHDRLFSNQQTLDPLAPHAEAVGLNKAAFEKCMSEGKYTAAVRLDLAESQKVGITGTPGFVVAVTDPKDPKKAKGVTFLRGAQPFDSFKNALDQALAAN
jgi:protein-disulfide isomerase